MEISENKSAAMLLARYYSIQKLWELSNDILSIHVTKRAINQQEIKFGGLKKHLKFSIKPDSSENEDYILRWCGILNGDIRPFM